MIHECFYHQRRPYCVNYACKFSCLISKLTKLSVLEKINLVSKGCLVSKSVLVYIEKVENEPFEILLRDLKNRDSFPIF